MVESAQSGRWHVWEGRRVWYRREGAGRPIVFLPNATLTWRLWEHQVEHFRASHDVIAVDLPGFGRSDRMRLPTLEAYVRWLGRFVEELGLAPTMLVGNCIGSLTALHYAARDPDAVSGLVLVNLLTAEGIETGSLGRLTRIYAGPRKATLPLVRRYLRHMPRRHQRRFPYVRDQLGPIGRETGREYTAHVRRCYADPSTRLAQLELGRDRGNWVLPDRSRLAALPPVCWIWGGSNRLLPLEAGERARAALEPAERHVLDGCGYAAACEQPGRVTRIIEDFMRAVENEARSPAAVAAGE